VDRVESLVIPDSWCLRWGIWVSGRSDQSFCANTGIFFLATLSPIFPAPNRMVRPPFVPLLGSRYLGGMVWRCTRPKGGGGDGSSLFCRCVCMAHAMYSQCAWARGRVWGLCCQGDTTILTPQISETLQPCPQRNGPARCPASKPPRKAISAFWRPRPDLLLQYPIAGGPHRPERHGEVGGVLIPLWAVRAVFALNLLSLPSILLLSLPSICFGADKGKSTGRSAGWFRFFTPRSSRATHTEPAE
jgi:hypothetical protein